MVRKNPPAILSAFSRQMPWRYQPHDISTGRPLKARLVSPDQLADGFRQKKGWYDFVLADPN
jgi:hypothetical protein